MKHVVCPVCGNICIKYGKNKSGSQRWFCKNCSSIYTPKIDAQRDVVYVDGIYLGRKVCILICCDEKHVLGWYLCRYENARAWKTLMSRIAEPVMVVSDGGTGFTKALKKAWPKAKHQRCLFHVFCQLKKEQCLHTLMKN